LFALKSSITDLDASALRPYADKLVCTIFFSTFELLTDVAQVRSLRANPSLTSMSQEEKDQLLINHLFNYVTDRRRETLEKVLAQRTRHITLVLEDIFQSQNSSAAVRTCECLGIQDIHVIEKQSSYSVNKKVLKGANKWMDIIKYNEKNANNTERCYQQLRAAGYHVLVTDPSPDGISIDQVSVDKKIALVMGNELEGISEYALNNADQKVNIPMFGFTESFNISVSAAICLNVLLSKVRTTRTSWQLSDAEKQTLRLQWLRKMVRGSELIAQEFLRTIA
jgi:tRNA (guanosine-2'-O-)-methyltransferase